MAAKTVPADKVVLSVERRWSSTILYCTAFLSVIMVRPCLRHNDYPDFFPSLTPTCEMPHLSQIQSVYLDDFFIFDSVAYTEIHMPDTRKI